MYIYIYIYRRQQIDSGWEDAFARASKDKEGLGGSLGVFEGDRSTPSPGIKDFSFPCLITVTILPLQQSDRRRRRMAAYLRAEPGNGVPTRAVGQICGGWRRPDWHRKWGSRRIEFATSREWECTTRSCHNPVQDSTPSPGTP